MPTVGSERIGVDVNDVQYRPLPELTSLTKPFWTSGLDGHLRFLRCSSCGYYSHPAGPRCARCLEEELTYTPVSGLGTVYAFTVNHHPWFPGWTVPYVVAVVQLDEQEDLRLVTNVVGCAPESVCIGARVRVVFEVREDLALPLFELVDGDRPAEAHTR
jgi:uncharacterized OB-fold protein